MKRVFIYIYSAVFFFCLLCALFSFVGFIGALIAAALITRWHARRIFGRQVVDSRAFVVKTSCLIILLVALLIGTLWGLGWLRSGGEGLGVFILVVVFRGIPLVLGWILLVELLIKFLHVHIRIRQYLGIEEGVYSENTTQLPTSTPDTQKTTPSTTASTPRDTEIRTDAFQTPRKISVLTVVVVTVVALTMALLLAGPTIMSGVAQTIYKISEKASDLLFRDNNPHVL